MTQPARAINIPSLTGIRGIAALLVMGFHLPIQELLGLADPPAIIEHGYLGVDLFFILSGFILFHVHGAEFHSITWRDLRAFAIIRFFRVYPVHFIVLMLILAFVVSNPDYVRWFRSLPSDPSSGTAYSIAGFFQTLTLTNRIGLPDFGVWNGPTWSLSSEVIGYIAFPFIVWALVKTANLRICFAIAIFCLTAYCGVTILRGHMGLLRMVFCFPAGMALGYSYHLAGRANGAPWLTAFAALSSILLLVYQQTEAFSVFAFAALIYGLARGPSFVNTLLSLKPIVFLGKISFSLYLTHLPIIHIAAWSNIGSSSPRLALLSIVLACVAIASLCYLFIEKPFHAFGRRYAQNTLAPSAVKNVLMRV